MHIEQGLAAGANAVHRRDDGAEAMGVAQVLVYPGAGGGV